MVQGARDNLINECTNMGLISALMLTMILPMAYDHVNDWLEEARRRDEGADTGCEFRKFPSDRECFRRAETPKRITLEVVSSSWTATLANSLVRPRCMRRLLL